MLSGMKNFLRQPETLAVLAVLIVAGAGTGVALYSASSIEQADFQVCSPATGSCAGCHYFIPNSPPGCGGIMEKSAPGKNPHRPTAPKQPQQAVWQAHPGAAPLVRSAGL